MIRVIVEDDQGKREEFSFNVNEVLIGRQADCQVRLGERNISRHHVRVFQKGDATFLEDLNSYNGVFVNGERAIGCKNLKAKDIVEIGDYQVEISASGMAALQEESTLAYGNPLDPSEAVTLAGTSYPSEDTDSEQTIPDGEVEDYARNEPSTPKLPGGGIRGRQAVTANPLPLTATPTVKESPVRDRDLAEALRNVKDDPVEEGPRHEPTALIRLDQIDLSSLGGKAGQIQSDKQPKLLCVSTNLAGTEFLAQKSENIIGRIEEGNDIIINHRSISKHHAKLTISGTTYRVADLKSANGTLVNGEEYAQTILHHGDLLELGHVKLRFITPGRAYQPTPDEREAINLAQNGGASSSSLSDSRRGAADLAEEDRFSGGDFGATARHDTKPDGGGKSMTAIVGVMAGLMLIAMVVVIVILLMDRQETRGSIVSAQGTEQPAGGVAPVAAGMAGKSPESVALFQKALAAYNSRNFQDAMTLVNTVLTLTPDYQEAANLKNQLIIENKAEEVLASVKKAMEAKKYLEADRLLNDVPVNASSYSQVGELRPRIRAGIIDNLYERGINALGDGDVARAGEIANKIGALDPNAPQLGELRDQIAMAKQNASEEAETEHVAVAQQQRKPAKTAPKSASEPKPTPAKQTAPKNEPKATPAPAPATPAPAAASSNPKELYQQASKQLLQGNFSAAISTFENCIQIDNKACYCYRGLGIAYAKYRDSAKAVKYYKRYLSCNPNAPDAAQVTKIIQQYEAK